MYTPSQKCKMPPKTIAFVHKNINHINNKSIVGEELMRVITFVFPKQRLNTNACLVACFFFTILCTEIFHSYFA